MPSLRTIVCAKATSSCCPHAPPYYPFPRGISILGVIYGVSLWADTNAATPLGAWGHSVIAAVRCAVCGVRCAVWCVRCVVCVRCMQSTIVHYEWKAHATAAEMDTQYNNVCQTQILHNAIYADLIATRVGVFIYSFIFHRIFSEKPYHTIPYHTIPDHAIPYHTIPYPYIYLLGCSRHTFI